MQARIKKIVKWGSLVMLAGIITAGLFAYRLYNKPHRNVAKADAIHIRADSLATQYESDEGKANKFFLDKVLSVTGIIENSSLNQEGIPVIELKGTDMSTVRCTLAEKQPAGDISKGAECMLKGICTGYLTDVVLVRCIRIK